MLVTDFVKQIKELGINTLVGVPDSALKPFVIMWNGAGKRNLHILFQLMRGCNRHSDWYIFGNWYTGMRVYAK